MRAVSDAEARAVYDWLVAKGVKFRCGSQGSGDGVPASQQLAPGDPASRLGIGIIALQNQHYDEALSLFNEAIALNPADGMGYLMAGRALLAKGDVAAAVASSREAALRAPDNPEVAMGLGAALEKQGMLADALDEYDRAVQLAPHEVQDRLIFAQLAERMGAFDRARAAYQGAITAGGGEVEARRRLADMHVKNGDLDLAAAVLEDAIKVFPGDGDLKVRLADTQYRQRKHDLAEATLRAALRLPGTHLARAHYLMAFLDYHKGNPVAAQKDLDAAVALKPDMAEAYYLKGEIHAATGKADLARRAYEKAIQINATYNDAILALKRLEAKTSP